MEQTGALPGYAVRMIAAGEKAGRTEAVLNSLARYYASQARLQKKLRSAVVYPAVLLGLMAAILAVLLAWVLPVFTGVYEGLVGDIATSSYGYIRLAYWVGGGALAATLVLAVLVAAGAALGRTRRGPRPVLSRVFQRLPLTAAASRKLAVAQLAGALDIFIASGLDADAAMEAAEGMADHERAAQAAIAAARAQMAAGGRPWHAAVHDQKLFRAAVRPDAAQRRAQRQDRAGAGPPHQPLHPGRGRRTGPGGGHGGARDLGVPHRGGGRHPAVGDAAAHRHPGHGGIRRRLCIMTERPLLPAGCCAARWRR